MTAARWLSAECYAYAMGEYPAGSTQAAAVAARTERNLIDLRAAVAERLEDRRIATKHMHEAAARTMTPENHAAWKRSVRWWNRCVERERVARRDLIAATTEER